MTEAVYYNDAYQKELETNVSAVDGEWVEFEKTIFYPNAGGQPGDTGNVSVNGDAIEIVDTQKGQNQGSVRHKLADAQHGLSAGDSVQLTLDWERRFRLMRMHTALHLLCSLVPRGVTGGKVDPQKSRLDFDLGDHRVDKEKLTQSLNALVTESHAVSTAWITDEELSANPDLVRTMSALPPMGNGKVRMVKIDGVDYQPCGGTHVSNTAQVGTVRVSKIENKGNTIGASI